MPDYQKGKIYKIVCDETNLTYYGSTVQPLAKRLSQHKEHKDKKRFTSNKMTNMKIYLVEDYPCERKEQLLMRERWYIENNECCNRYIPLRTNKEYIEDNKEHLKEKAKEYYEKNKEHINQYHKEYYEKNKVLKGRPPLKTKEEKKEYQREFYDKNKERYKEKSTCECGSVFRKISIARHLKSKKHQSYISNLN